MSSEDAVRQASAQFYTALNHMLTGDAGKLSDIWAHDKNVTTLHPIGGRQVGWDGVFGSFSKVAGLSSNGEVTLKDQAIQVFGDGAYEIGLEQGKVTIGKIPVTNEHRVTNVYRRGPDGWKIIHHHTDVSPALVKAVKETTAEATHA